MICLCLMCLCMLMRVVFCLIGFFFFGLCFCIRRFLVNLEDRLLINMFNIFRYGDMWFLFRVWLMWLCRYNFVWSKKNSEICCVICVLMCIISSNIRIIWCVCKMVLLWIWVWSWVIIFRGLLWLIIKSMFCIFFLFWFVIVG